MSKEMIDEKLIQVKGLSKQDYIKIYLFLFSELDKNYDLTVSELAFRVGNELIDKGVHLPTLEVFNYEE